MLDVIIKLLQRYGYMFVEGLGNTLLLSAIANAENNLSMDRGSLYVAEVFANPGPTLKRYVARSKGSASPMLKRTSHITVVLDQK